MAPPPRDLAEIGREGFDLIRELCGTGRWPHPPPRVPPQLTSENLFRHDPCLHHRSQAPLVTERLPTYHESVVHYPSAPPLLEFESPHQPPQRGWDRPAGKPVETGVMDCYTAAIAYRGRAIIDYGRGF